MDNKLNALEQVKADAQRLTLRRIRENAEDQGLPMPPRAAHGDVVLPKVKESKEQKEPVKRGPRKVNVREAASEEQPKPAEPEAAEPDEKPVDEAPKGKKAKE